MTRYDGCTLGPTDDEDRMRNRGNDREDDVEQGSVPSETKKAARRPAKRTNRDRMTVTSSMARLVATVILVLSASFLLRRHTKQSSQSTMIPLQLVSDPSWTRISASVRGNLGPPDVMLNNSTSDWLQDRWQAASDMHGTAIRGAHWVLLEFVERLVTVERVVLDWESAYSDDYQLVGLGLDNVTTILYDTLAASSAENAISLPSVMTTKWGRSPGVDFKCPLHIQHTIVLQKPTPPLSALRLTIRKPAQHGWGVSLWRFQVYGGIVTEFG